VTPPPPAPPPSGFARFRVKLLVAMMLVVSLVTALLLFFAQRNVAANVQRDLEHEFQGELASLRSAEEIRYAMLAERCRALARRPRIHAALEDDALDLLYPSARDELADVMDADDQAPRAASPYAFHARFYRFLDSTGRVISPPDAQSAGRLTPREEAQLTLPAVPDRLQTGYLLREAPGPGETIDEVLAMPIISTETGRIIAALVLGFKPFELGARQPSVGLRSGLWLRGRLYLPALPADEQSALGRQVTAATAAAGDLETSFAAPVAGAPSLLFCRLLNPGSPFSPAYEVCIYPLATALSRQRQLTWQFVAAGALVLIGAFAASQFFSRRLSRPVEKLAVDSEENRTQRQRAETALELTSQELQRSARFSADASHQLKTPVTVLRAGLEELLAGEKLSPENREEISALVHQTFRLTSVIEDLLLLSRMDAGRLQIEFAPVDLIPLLEGWLDDLGALPDGPELAVETDLPPDLVISGEKRYATLILQNLLENARKYNRPGGRIRLAARAGDGWAVLLIGNTGRPIPVAARERIFERFHRGSAGENIPGHGLGLNLARELARLHGGDLRLARSDEAWTEFEVRFRLARPAPTAAADPA
jgi:signal transduction histidine kinase